MSRWLAIQITFLSGRYHGSRTEGATEGEWPPAPHRVFSALVAAAHLGTRAAEWSQAKADAFRWLERLEPPEVIAPHAEPLSTYTLAVPNNDMDAVARVWASGNPNASIADFRTMKPMRPHEIGGGMIHVCWRIPDDVAAVANAELLCAEARHLHHVGLGIDLVVGQGSVLSDAEKNQLDGQVWVPDPNGRLARVPTAGSLEELNERYTQFLGRVSSGSVTPPKPPAVVGRVDYRRRGTPRPRRYTAFIITNDDGTLASVDPSRTMHVSAWLRHAAKTASARLGHDEAFLRDYVCGHGEGEASTFRFSYVPLPSVGHLHADGRIRRALLVDPFGNDDVRAGEVARALNGQPLVDIESKVRGYLSLANRSSDQAQVIDRYVRRSRMWGSVTPVVLPGLDDGKSRKAVALVLKGLGQAGYATPIEQVSVQSEPVFAGSLMARSYAVPEHLRKWPRVHVLLRFTEEVPGPILLGSGRHSGLGVFAALDAW